MEAPRVGEIEQLEDHCRQNPDDYQALVSLGVAYARAGRHEDALGPLRRAAELRDKDAPAHFNLGRALALAGRRAEAEAEYRSALALDPGYAPAVTALKGMASQGDVTATPGAAPAPASPAPSPITAREPEAARAPLPPQSGRPAPRGGAVAVVAVLLLALAATVGFMAYQAHQTRVQDDALFTRWATAMEALHDANLAVRGKSVKETFAAALDLRNLAEKGRAAREELDRLPSGRRDALWKRHREDVNRIEGKGSDLASAFMMGDLHLWVQVASTDGKWVVMEMRH